ncbi:MAG: hypothetical protein H6670_02610 [Anaerolineaceae bacterium]|nr:hypothetical protein [Anaerolineaceae bacterium]
MFIDSEQAAKIARSAITQTQREGDPLFAPWSAAVAGIPLLVSTVFKQPSYWLVPVNIQQQLIGFVRILGTGEVAAVGVYYRDPAHFKQTSPASASMTGAEAREVVEQTFQLDPGESVGAATFVHDGPIGREAWLVEIVRGEAATTWVFVTPAGMYERPVGSAMDGPGLLG